MVVFSDRANHLFIARITNKSFQNQNKVLSQQKTGIGKYGIVARFTERGIFFELLYMGITGKSLYTRCCFLLIIMPIKLLIKLVCANMLLDKFQLRRCLICSFLMSGMPVSCVGIFPGLESPKRSVHPVTCPPPTSSLTSSTLCICSPSMTNGTWSAIQL